MTQRPFSLVSVLLFFSLLMWSCGPGQTFEEQIIEDITTHIPSGACEEFPEGTSISNVQVGEIVPIEGMGMIDVSYSFDYVVGDKKGTKKSAMLYIDKGYAKELASMGSDCEL